MDNKNKMVTFVPRKNYENIAKVEGWEEDTDTVEMDMNDLSDIADGYKMIRKGLELISKATGVGLDSI